MRKIVYALLLTVFANMAKAQVTSANGTFYRCGHHQFRLAHKHHTVSPPSTGINSNVNWQTNPVMSLSRGGSVMIGTWGPGTYKLAVAGKIAAWDEIKVFTNGSSFPDYVFDADYKLRSLEETEKYIKENHHLPEVPSAAEVAKEGMSLNGMSEILLKKVEELTLHLIEMKKESAAMRKENEELKKWLEKLEKK